MMERMEMILQEAQEQAQKLERLLYIAKIHQEEIKSRWKSELKEDVK